MARFKSSHPEHQLYEDWVELHAFTADDEVATGTGAIEAEIPADCRAVLVHLWCNPAAAGGDTIDVYVETLLICSGVEVWIDVVHFTQLLGNGLTVYLFDKIVASLDEGNFDNSAALAVDTQRNIMGEKWRCRWVIAGATPAFPFQVRIFPQ